MTFWSSTQTVWIQDGRGIGWGGHLFPHKYIKRSSSSRGPQTSRKASQYPWNEVGQKIKTKKKTKDYRTGTCPREWVLKETFPHIRSPLTGGFVGSLGTSERSTMKQIGGASGKESASNAGYERDLGSIPGLGRSPGEGHGNPLQCSCLENPLDRGTRWATVHRITKSWTWLKQFNMHVLPISGHL